MAVPILKWLVEGKLPSDQTEARHIAHRAKVFVLNDGELYKRGATGILMRCILGDQGRELLQEIHVDNCGHHARSENTCQKGFLTRLLLAHSSRGLQGHRTTL
jgi:hypothetical protein